MVRVLVVDDSPLMRSLLTQLLQEDPEITVVATAADPYEAWDLLKAQAVDVITLDLQMPRMNGLTFLRKLMAARPTPVVVVSTPSIADRPRVLRAMKLGAIDIVYKPNSRGTARLAAMSRELSEKVKQASLFIQPVFRRERTAATRPIPFIAGESANPKVQAEQSRSLIVIGASTGGPETISRILAELPAQVPPILIVQHMPSDFTGPFAERLNRQCRFEVREAVDGDALETGLALLAPGDRHMMVEQRGSRKQIRLLDGPPVNQFRPSVDVTFRSCASLQGVAGVGVLLTGMGKDGAQGLLALRQAGFVTLAQDEETCVVYGMPREAIELGAARYIVPLEKIGPWLANRFRPRLQTASRK